MTREEIITKVQNLINQAYKYDIDSEYYEGLFDEIEKLRQPPTLAEFLGWEEGVEYDYCNARFRIKNGVLERRFTDAYNVDRYWELAEERLTDSRIIDLRQATKVQKKLKAYHVKDEYDFEALKEELIKRGYKKDDAWGLKLDNVPLYLDWVGKLEYVLEIDKNLVKFYTKHDFEEVEDNYEVEEYKDERLYYAKIKGWELYKDNDRSHYWKYYIENELFASYKDESEHYKTKFTKSEWNGLGINDTNADFEEVEE